MANVVARVLASGDDHFSSKNYGAHRNYPKETLHYMAKITEEIQKRSVTHHIGLGDFSFGRFHTLEYRLEVEKQLAYRHNILGGNEYSLKGNHDSATYGLTEYEYYVKRGIIKPAENLDFGKLKISMVDFGKHNSAKILEPDPNAFNVVFAHDYFKFNSTRLPDYGDAIYLDEFEPWAGIDYLVCGHIHKFHAFSGNICVDKTKKSTGVTYLNCMARPSYIADSMDTEGHMLMFTVYDDGEVEIEQIEIPLLPISESFNLEAREEEAKRKEDRKLDISDIVQNLNSHVRTIGSPEETIMSMVDIDMEYRQAAIRLLREAGA